VQRIFVGDVQGCADEFEQVIERARREFGDAFELWLVGDLVNRGPASRRVLERVRALDAAGRARVVLGNHELALLRVALGQRRPAPGDTFQDLLEGPDRDAWLDWIRSWPLAIADRLGAQRFAMVHAAVAPDWGLAELEARARRAEARLRRSLDSAAELLAAEPEQDADADVLARVTRCRSIDADGRWSSRPPARPKDAWHQRWAARAHEYGVVYGHWALQGLHVAPMLRGLDSGCVYNGAPRATFLTAWLPPVDAREPFRVPDEHFWRIPARSVYWRGAAE
jgi:bis(5'-nucleosyl)-tetraphosphatase (symmetrical)